MAFKLSDVRCVGCGSMFVDVLFQKGQEPVPDEDALTKNCAELAVESECRERCTGPFVEVLSVPGQKKHSSWLVDGGR